MSIDVINTFYFFRYWVNILTKKTTKWPLNWIFSQQRKRADQYLILDYCIFCSQKFSKTGAVVPDVSKLSSLLEASRQRLDVIGRLIIEHEKEIVSGEVTFRYHRNCRATYCSKTLVLHACAAANTGAKVIVVCSPGTDVLLLLLHHWPTINKGVYFLTGKGGKYTIVIRYILVHILYNSLTKLQHTSPTLLY